MSLRRISLQLNEPTRPKETELCLLPTLGVDQADATLVARMYRRRWILETTLQSLTQALHCEIETLAYPKAALLGFGLAVVASKILAVIRAATRSEHGSEAVEERVSNDHLVPEAATTSAGMMIALAPEEGDIFVGLDAGGMAELL